MNSPGYTLPSAETDFPSLLGVVEEPGYRSPGGGLETWCYTVYQSPAVWFSAPGSLPQLASRWCFAEGGIIGAEVWYHLQVVEIICRVREFLHCIFLLGGLQLSLLILQRGIRCLFFCLFLLFLH